MNNKRILILSHSEVGTAMDGSITVLIDLCNVLIQNGYDVTVLCYGPNVIRPWQLNNKVRFLNPRTEYSPMIQYDEAVNRAVGEISPGLIIFFFPYLYVEARLESVYDSIPRILMFHFDPKLEFVNNPTTDIVLRKRYTNTCTQVLHEHFKDGLPDYIKEGHVVVIPNAISQFEKQVDYDTEHKKMVFFSRIDTRKGVNLLIDAFSLIQPEHPDWSIDIYGYSTSPDYTNFLKEEVKSRQLENNIFFKGVTKDKENTLIQYDFCVFPSYEEGFSIGLGETMSAGLPCIGLKRCTGVNGMIIDGYNGLLCEDTPESVAEAMSVFINHKGLRSYLGKNAKAYISQFTYDSVYEKWLDLVKKMIKDN